MKIKRNRRSWANDYINCDKLVLSVLLMLVEMVSGNFRGLQSQTGIFTCAAIAFSRHWTAR